MIGVEEEDEMMKKQAVTNSMGGQGQFPLMRKINHSLRRNFMNGSFTCNFDFALEGTFPSGLRFFPRRIISEFITGSRPFLRYYSSVCLAILRKTTKHFKTAGPCDRTSDFPNTTLVVYSETACSFLPFSYFVPLPLVVKSGYATEYQSTSTRLRTAKSQKTVTSKCTIVL
jgi:hypothetical protein